MPEFLAPDRIVLQDEGGGAWSVAAYAGPVIVVPPVWWDTEVRARDDAERMATASGLPIHESAR